MAHYAATKAAMVNMTKVSSKLILLEYNNFIKTDEILKNLFKTAAIQYIPHNIRINAVAPTGVNTEMIKVSKNGEIYMSQ